MQVVLDTPMGAAGIQDPFGLGRQRGDIESRFAGRLPGFLVRARAGDGGDAARALPVRVPLPRPGGVIGDPAGAFLDTAVSGVKRAGHEAGLRYFRIVEKQPPIFVRRALVALQGKDVIRLLLHDACGDLLLGPHGVHGDDGAFQGEAFQKRRDRRDFVAFAVNRLLAQNQPVFVGEGIENMLRLAVPAVLRPVQGSCPIVGGNLFSA